MSLSRMSGMTGTILVGNVQCIIQRLVQDSEYDSKNGKRIIQRLVQDTVYNSKMTIVLSSV